MKKFSLALSMVLCLCFCLCSCLPVSEDEESQMQTLTVSDPDYYTQLQDKNISINVYNWGEYIADGSDGGLDINDEFSKLTGINVNYIRRRFEL